MKTSYRFEKRFTLDFDFDNFRRRIAGKEMVVHCHHYNARLQNAIESVSQIDGKKIISSSAETVFSEQIGNLFTDADSIEDQWQIATELYAHLGYGRLDISRLEAGEIEATSSHYVEGWSVCFGDVKRPICTFTEGCLQGMVHRITGDLVTVREIECMHQGAPRCRFVLDHNRTEPFTSNEKKSFLFTPMSSGEFLNSQAVDEEKIIGALAELPLSGNDEGLIPQFNVYLASTPADFYNLVTIRFIETMGDTNRLNTARRLLLFCAEVCGLMTFRGIMQSPEWDALIEPMIENDTDRLLAIIAISNGLGWGNWHVVTHQPEISLQLQSLNGYEAIGYREYREQSDTPQCLMFTGVAAGIMELLYGEGTVEELYGSYLSNETSCICCGDDNCCFEAHIL